MDEDTDKKRKRIAETADIGVQAHVYNKYYIQCEISMCTVWLLSVVFGIVSVFIGSSWYVSVYGPRWHVSKPLLNNIGHHGVLLFRQYDRDGDGYLSLEEFEPLAHNLKDLKQTTVYNDTIEDGDEVLTVKSYFQPLILETLSKDNETLFGSAVDSLLGLKSWRVPAKEWQNFGASQFRVLLPNSLSDEMEHKPYTLIKPIYERGPTLSNNRFYPPQLVSDEEILLHRLLSLLHPRPFIYTRFAPQGCFAVIRASSDNYLDIVFRLHAEFQLNEPPINPFWFTPAQFTGHLIIERSALKVIDFHMFVPTDKRLNVDMEWLNGPQESESMEVDIGYMPQMELKATGPSTPMYQNDKNVQNDFLHNSQDDTIDIKWTDEISYVVAARLLEVRMYPFKKVQYHNFSDIWPAAKKENKPVHSILLWGALDDQSC